VLAGRFNSSGQPFIAGKLSLPRLSARGQIDWLISTASDRSTLKPEDVEWLHIEYSRLNAEYASRGPSGERHYVEPVLLTFTEPGVAEHTYWFDLQIAVPGDDLNDEPSVLGRDVLDNWLMLYSPLDDLLEFEVRRSDSSMPYSS
jgi:hypothetical protein